MWPSPLDMASAEEWDEDQPAKPSAILRFTSMLNPLRSFCMNAARSTAISNHARHPFESSRFITCPKLFRIDARVAFADSHVASQHTHPRDRPRFIM